MELFHLWISNQAEASSCSFHKDYADDKRENISETTPTNMILPFKPWSGYIDRFVWSYFWLILSRSFSRYCISTGKRWSKVLHSCSICIPLWFLHVAYEIRSKIWFSLKVCWNFSELRVSVRFRNIRRAVINQIMTSGSNHEA